MCRGRTESRVIGIEPGQAYLSAMGMTAQQQIEIGMRGLAIDLRRVRQQDRKLVVRDLGCGLLYVVDPEIVGIVDAGEVDPLQHAYAHFLEPRHHPDRIVVAEHAIDRLLRWDRTLAMPSSVASNGPKVCAR